jgi:cell wall-associated NlpC family hydrolase
MEERQFRFVLATSASRMGSSRSTTTSTIFRRASAATVISAAAAAAVLAFPAPAQAAPSLAEQLKTVKSQLREANGDLADLKEQRDDLDDRIAAADLVIDGAEQSLTGVPGAIETAGSPLDRLSELTGYSTQRSLAVSTALATRHDAGDLLDRVETDIDDQQDEVTELTDERDKLADRIATRQAEKSEPADNASAAESSDGSGVVGFARSQLGEPYVYGAAGPDSWDCSGLTMAAWQEAGVSLGHNTNEQFSQTERVSRDALQPGDLVFYSGMGHVALYIGDGQIIHAPTEGDVVKIADIDMMSPEGYGRP